MRLVSVTVENFRSITSARQIPLSQLTTLIGPNNEGKSNILKALGIAMSSLVGRRQLGVRTPTGASRPIRRYIKNSYDPEVDLPVNKSGKDIPSVVTLEFKLNSDEITEFESYVGSKLNGTLPISFTYSRNNEDISVIKQGRGKASLEKKANIITEFVAGKIEVQYIPAIRTAESAKSIVDQLVSKELEAIEQDQSYKEALAAIAALQQPILDRLSQGITDTLRSFLPNIRSANILISEQRRSIALRDLSEIYLDDGVRTSIENKGDGVKSLAALALMRHASQLTSAGKDVVIALEEPESHLHPNAIRQLRDVLVELSEHHQVVITTHNPIFANRVDVNQNIIVNKNRARPAKCVKEVRDILGVRLDDNLTSAEVILLVEGDEDRISLSGILSDMSQVIKESLSSGRLAFDVLGGAGNLAHRARLHSEALCKVHAVLDHDRSGQDSFKKASAEGAIGAAAVNFTVVDGKTESELEDIYVDAVFQEIVQEKTGFQLEAKGLDSKKKWCDRVHNLIRRAGKPDSNILLGEIKIEVANKASSMGARSLHDGKRGPIDSLSRSLEALLSRH